MPESKVWDWGKRYDVGELYGIPALVGHEFALVSSGIRGGRVNYYPPASASVECTAGLERPDWRTAVGGEHRD
jgi:hypothetical protein